MPAPYLRTLGLRQRGAAPTGPVRTSSTGLPGAGTDEANALTAPWDLMSC